MEAASSLRLLYLRPASCRRWRGRWVRLVGCAAARRPSAARGWRHRPAGSRWRCGPPPPAAATPAAPAACPAPSRAACRGPGLDTAPRPAHPASQSAMPVNDTNVAVASRNRDFTFRSSIWYRIDVPFLTRTVINFQRKFLAGFLVKISELKVPVVQSGSINATIFFLNVAYKLTS